MPTSPDFPYESKHIEVHRSRMHYVEAGEGDPILFLHGNPTSSYLWRNVIPHVVNRGRAIAIVLIGMGKSDKPDISYRFFDHLEYLEGFIDALDLKGITLVIHDWGGGLGLSYARRHPESVRRIAFMEAVIRPFTWDDMNTIQRIMFKRMRDPIKGDRMNMDKNFFIKRLVQMMINRKLTEPEKVAYASPFPTPQSRKPVAMWPREIPISGEPHDMYVEISENYEWFTSTQIPKLFLYARPGAVLPTALHLRFATALRIPIPSSSEEENTTFRRTSRTPSEESSAHGSSRTPERRNLAQRIADPLEVLGMRDMVTENPSPRKIHAKNRCTRHCCSTHPRCFVACLGRNRHVDRRSELGERSSPSGRHQRHGYCWI